MPSFNFETSFATGAALVVFDEREFIFSTTSFVLISFTTFTGSWRFLALDLDLDLFLGGVAFLIIVSFWSGSFRVLLAKRGEEILGFGESTEEILGFGESKSFSVLPLDKLRSADLADRAGNLRSVLAGRSMLSVKCKKFHNFIIVNKNELTKLRYVYQPIFLKE